jgi:type II secretory pathway pseudopilin PulG
MKSERKRSKKEIKPKMAKAPEEPQDDAAKARLRAARLQVELLKAQQELAALEAQELASTEQRVRNSQTTGNTGATIAHPSNLDDELRPDGSDYTSSDLSESGGSQDDNTSSEDSSSDDSDAAPFEVSAKEPVIEQVVEENPQPRSRRICRDFEKRGRCKFGNRCRYTHEKPVRDAVAKKPKQEAQSNKRVSLYQRLLKQQEEEENKRVLENITHLGDNGLLDEPDVGNSSATLNGPSS